MLVDNFYNLVRMGMLFGAGYPIKLVNTSGSKIDFKTSYSTSDAPFALKVFLGFYTDYLFTSRPDSYNKVSGISVGSGTGAAKATDYWLEKQITSGITGSIIANENTIDSSGNCFGEVTLNIVAQSNIVIGELGWSAGWFLLDRTVLDTPISLSAGQTASIKYRITNASIFNV